MSQALVRKESYLPVGSLEQYIGAMQQIPMLTAQEEIDLANRYREHNDLDAARRLVMSHLRFVVRIARGYQGYGLALADLVQEGTVGLMKAVRRFNPDLKVRLVSFAVHWIRAEMHEFILRNWRIVKIATTKAQRKLFFGLRSSKKHLGWLTHDEVKAVADELGVPEKTVMEMESRMSGQDVSFDLGVNDKDDEHAHAPVTYLQDLRADPARELEDGQWEEQKELKLHQALSQLDARSREILGRRWLSEPKATLQELADAYQISAERIRQIENQAMNKIKSMLQA